MHGDVSPVTVTNGSCKLTAADFDAEAVPLSTFVLNGQDYSKERSMKVSTDLLWPRGRDTSQVYH